MRRLKDLHPLVLGTYAVLTVLTLVIVVAAVADARGGRTGPPGSVGPPLEPVPLADGSTLADGARGRQAPEGPFEVLGGGTATLADYRGRPVVLNLFASWCRPCVTEMPEIELVHTELGRDVAFLGLAIRDAADDVVRLVERTGVTYDIGRDTTGGIVTGLGVTVMPTTYLLDPDGRIVATHAGELDAGELRALVRQHLAG
jgi:thiol-disulfide isomerase/thioredoxin